MTCEHLAATTPQPVLATIPGVANDLTAEQRSLLDALWDYFCNTGESFPKRRLLHVLGTKPITAIMQEMASGLMQEQFESGEKRYSLTMWGALSSSKGEGLVGLYVRLLDLVKTLHQEDDGISQIDSDLIREKLAVSETESSQLGAFARIVNLPGMPIHFAGHTTNRSKWFLTIREDVVDLFHAANSIEYFVQRLLKGQQAPEPNNALASLLATQPAGMWWNEISILSSPASRAGQFGQELFKGLRSFLSKNRVTLAKARSSFIAAQKRNPRWTKFDEDDYKAYIDAIKLLRAGKPLYSVEEH